MFRHVRTKILMLGFFLAGAPLALAASDDPQSPEALAKARLEIARQNYEDLVDLMFHPPAGPEKVPLETTVERLATWSRRWMEAERDMSDKKAGRVAAIEAHWKRMKKWEEMFASMAEGESSGVNHRDVATLRYYRLEAEYWLAKAKAEP